MDILISVICSVVASCGIVVMLNYIANIEKDEYKEKQYDGFGILENRLATLDYDLKESIDRLRLDLFNKIQEYNAINFN